MDKYIQAERRLAELLGFTMIRPSAFEQGRLVGRINDDKEKIPAWCRDWSACGPLMVEHGVWPFIQPDGYVDTFISGLEPDPDIDTPLSDHPDRDTAVRYCVVMAVIAKLEANNV